jgi:hypothetical protein
MPSPTCVGSSPITATPRSCPRPVDSVRR